MLLLMLNMFCTFTSALPTVHNIAVFAVPQFRPFPARYSGTVRVVVIIIIIIIIIILFLSFSHSTPCVPCPPPVSTSPPYIDTHLPPLQNAPTERTYPCAIVTILCHVTPCILVLQSHKNFVPRWANIYPFKRFHGTEICAKINLHIAVLLNKATCG